MTPRDDILAGGDDAAMADLVLPGVYRTAAFEAGIRRARAARSKEPVADCVARIAEALRLDNNTLERIRRASFSNRQSTPARRGGSAPACR